jgi:hypothetical protein
LFPVLECGSLLPLYSCEIARSSPVHGTRFSAWPASWPEQKRQQAAALQSASNRNNPVDADLARRSKPIDQLSRVMLNVANVVKLQFELTERKPMAP